jgi:hypothetical protein
MNLSKYSKYEETRKSGKSDWRTLKSMDEEGRWKKNKNSNGI